MKLQKTITSIFIVPTLSIPREKLADNGYINGYIKDDMKDVQYENAVYLLFKPKNLDKFKEFLDEEYERSKQVIDDYDYINGYVIVVYLLNPKLNADIQLIKEGKYSQTSKKFQEIFPKIVKITKLGFIKDEISLQYRIFNKTQDLYDYWENILGTSIDNTTEIWQGFFEENETLNFNKLKENV